MRWDFGVWDRDLLQCSPIMFVTFSPKQKFLQGHTREIEILNQTVLCRYRSNTTVWHYNLWMLLRCEWNCTAYGSSKQECLWFWLMGQLPGSHFTVASIYILLLLRQVTLRWKHIMQLISDFPKYAEMRLRAFAINIDVSKKKNTIKKIQKSVKNCRVAKHRIKNTNLGNLLRN